MFLPFKTKQRNAAWICPLGQPNRSYKSRWRKAVSRSSRQRRPTTRRPSQTHSGLPAGPLSMRRASTKSSVVHGALPELGSVGCWSTGLASVLSAKAEKFSDPSEAARSHRTTPSPPRTLGTRRDINSPNLLGSFHCHPLLPSKAEHCALTMAAEASSRHCGRQGTPSSCKTSRKAIAASLMSPPQAAVSIDGTDDTSSGDGNRCQPSTHRD